MLNVEGLRSRYGRIEVLHGIDLAVNSGEIVTVVGANGAGKTTLLRCLSGVQPVTGGTITFRGESFTAVPAYKRLGYGLAQSPEGRQIFTNLTVEENLRLGAFLYTDDRVEKDMANAFAMFPILKEKRNLVAGGLSGGQQQMLAIARALMGRPSCLLLDEPSMGLAPIIVAQIFEVVNSMKALDVTVLLVEQNAFGALKIADRGYVLETGRVTMDGAGGRAHRRPAHPRSLPGDLSMTVEHRPRGPRRRRHRRQPAGERALPGPPPVPSGTRRRRSTPTPPSTPSSSICAGRTFIAGADVSEFGKPPQPPHLPDLVARIEAAKKPWTAAIHGSALGGGFEVALACRFRVALPSASVGLPEVTLGIVPGAGGTVRLPRLVPPAVAVDLVTTGKPVKAPKALELGLDRPHRRRRPPRRRHRLRRRTARRSPRRSATARPCRPTPASGRRPRSRVRKAARGEAAPLRALACLRRATETDFDAAMAFERETFLELRASPEAAALRHVFFAERAAPRPATLKGVEPRPVRSAAVIGGGTMGAGIAAALRDAGLPVTLVERDDEALARGLANLRGIFDGAVKRGRLTEADAAARMAAVTAATDYAALADTDLVIEAVFEDLAVKRAVFDALGRACRPDAILATNTSYLDPRAIAEGLPNPSRFIGLHFFSPANVMKLLEIVPTPETAPETLATGFALAAKLRKIPVQAGICDGFIGNRILKRYRAAAEDLVRKGVAIADIDAAMRAYRLRHGPLRGPGPRRPRHRLPPARGRPRPRRGHARDPRRHPRPRRPQRPEDRRRLVRLRARRPQAHALGRGRCANRTTDHARWSAVRHRRASCRGDGG